MKKIFVCLIILLFPLLVHADEDTVFNSLKKIALEGELLQKSQFYLVMKVCKDTNKSLHLSYYEKGDTLIFGYFTKDDGIIKNIVWDESKKEIYIVSAKYDVNIDLKNAKKITENQVEDLAKIFWADWVLCK